MTQEDQTLVESANLAKPLCIGIAATILPVLIGCYVGQRLLSARIEKDGQLVLRTQFAVPDFWSKQAAWKRLEGQSFEVVGHLKPLSEESGQTVLKGKIRLLLIHVNSPFATADVESLRLVPDPAKKGNWQIEPGEVKRTGKAIN